MGSYKDPRVKQETEVHSMLLGVIFPLSISKVNFKIAGGWVGLCLCMWSESRRNPYSTFSIIQPDEHTSTGKS